MFWGNLLAQHTHLAVASRPCAMSAICNIGLMQEWQMPVLEVEVVTLGWLASSFSIHRYYVRHAKVMH